MICCADNSIIGIRENRHSVNRRRYDRLYKKAPRAFHPAAFTTYTRQNRPSKAAIDCEIMYLHPNMYEMHNRLEEFDELIQFVYDQISIIDMIIRNLESRHYDL